MSKTPLVRFTVALSQRDADLLALWAGLHGKGRSSYAAQLISQLIDQNAAFIRNELHELAVARGMIVEQLTNEILKGDEQKDT